MNKSAIKNFAVNARRKLIESVSQKAYGLGISIDEIKEIEEVPNGSRIKINKDYVYLTNTETEHRDRLIEQIKYKGYEQVIEEVAYTWFNRIIALRFMEVNEYLPTRIRVLSSGEENKIEPDAVTDALDLIDDLGLDREKIYNYKDNNDTEGLFKYILIKQCNALGKIMPVMFEKIQDYTELLLPDNLLVEGSVIRDLVNNIEEDDFKEQVEIIGWLYQYYISEKKDEVFAGLKKNKKITKENIPAATQLFTPDWIVKYMVENSLGRLWIEGHPNEELKKRWKYYLEEATQEPDVEKKLEKIREESKKLSPEEITVLDPAMGSGHILVYAFDVLYDIYLSAGYSERDIPRLILEKNIYGLDIDDRAGQLAYFALIMKARSYSRRFFRDIEREPIELNVCSIQESNDISKEDIEYFADGDEKLKRDVEYLVEKFTDAKEYGSILEVGAVDFDRIEKRLNDIKEDNINLFNKDIKKKLIAIISIIVMQYRIMVNKYDVCITNPPYMGSKNMGKLLNEYCKKNYVNGKSDLCTVFIDKCIEYTKENRYTSMITMHSWMFLGSYENLRYNIINNNFISTMVHLGTRAFEEIGGEVVQTVSWIMKKSSSEKIGKYIRLTDYNSSNMKEKEFFNNSNIFNSNQLSYNQIPGTPIAYWASRQIVDIFKKSKQLGEISAVRKGLITSNNDRFLRLWHEISNLKIGLNYYSDIEAKYSKKKWFPYVKGGSYRKWYGNYEYLLNYYNDGEELKAWVEELAKEKPGGRIINKEYYFKEGITWSSIGTNRTSFRYVNRGSVYSNTGMGIFVKEGDIKYIIGFLNSKICEYMLQVISPTMGFEALYVSKIPVIIKNKTETKDIINKNIIMSKYDWDSFETSWDFKKHPIIEFKSNNIENSFKNWSNFTEQQFNQLKSNEEELNRIFIDIYGLQDELTPDVEDKDITIRKADRDREMKSFISYAVGCMMGRYSLDEEGLVFAGGEFDKNRYKTFKADYDAIITITDMEYFEDDIVSRFVEFVKLVFGEETLEENLNYIADTECFKRKSNETSRECLRRYFLKGFMEDHLKIYQKRPIYWMFDSGKQNGFKALIYMHRYDENMVAKVRADYLHVLQKKYEAEINRLGNDLNSEILSSKEKLAAKKLKEKIQKQLAECKQYDQVISHVAHQRIAIDLDDGVKINYQKFQGVEVLQDDGKKDLKQDLLFKVKM